MGIYINQSMPKKCNECRFSKYCDYPDPLVYGHHCTILNKKILDPDKSRLEDCPLHEVDLEYYCCCERKDVT